MIRKILLLFAIAATVSYAQQVRGIDLHSSAKDTIDARAQAVMGANPGFTLDANSKAVVQDTVADTTALKAYGGKGIIYLRKLSSTNSYGAGWFIYSDSSYIENGIIAYNTVANGKQWVRQEFLINGNKIINMAWSGGKGDGVTDNTEYFNRVQEVGRNIYFPIGYWAGNYVVNYDNVNITGAKKPTIETTNPYYTVFLSYDSAGTIIDTNWKNRINILNINFDGHNSTYEKYAGVGLHSRYSGWGSVENCLFRDFRENWGNGIAVWADTTYGVEYNTLSFADNSTAVYFYGHNSFSTFTHCAINSSYKYATHFVNAGHVNFYSCDMETGSSSAYADTANYWVNPNHVNIYGGYFEGSTDMVNYLAIYTTSTAHIARVSLANYTLGHIYGPAISLTGTGRHNITITNCDVLFGGDYPIDDNSTYDYWNNINIYNTTLNKYGVGGNEQTIIGYTKANYKHIGSQSDPRFVINKDTYMDTGGFVNGAKFDGAGKYENSNRNVILKRLAGLGIADGDSVLLVIKNSQPQNPTEEIGTFTQYDISLRFGGGTQGNGQLLRLWGVKEGANATLNIDTLYNAGSNTKLDTIYVSSATDSTINIYIVPNTLVTSYELTGELFRGTNVNADSTDWSRF